MFTCTCNNFRFFDIVGFHNTQQSSRWSVWQSAAVCGCSLSLPQLSWLWTAVLFLDFFMCIKCVTSKRAPIQKCLLYVDYQNHTNYKSVQHTAPGMSWNVGHLLRISVTVGILTVTHILRSGLVSSISASNSTLFAAVDLRSLRSCSLSSVAAVEHDRSVLLKVFIY